MSLSKELCLRSDSQNSDSFSDCFLNKFESKEDNYRRDSFEDRFCDDLCEEILQYSSLEDKVRLTKVSKQFQRTVFQRHYELYINIGDPKDHKNYLDNKNLYLIRGDPMWYPMEVQGLRSVKALLKKCSNITSIKMDGRYCSGYKINQVFQLVIKYCNKLSELIVWGDNVFEFDLNDSTFVEFLRKFGPKIKYFYYPGKIDWSLFPNIEKLRIRDVLLSHYESLLLN